MVKPFPGTSLGASSADRNLSPSLSAGSKAFDKIFEKVYLT
jgi:hypothetical protein